LAIPIGIEARRVTVWTTAQTVMESDGKSYTMILCVQPKTNVCK